jgi:hypothetical protein
MHPWQSTHDDFLNKTIPLLKRHGKTIGEKAQAGDSLCIRIMTHYELLRRSFDPMNFLLLGEALEEYLGGDDRHYSGEGE